MQIIPIIYNGKETSIAYAFQEEAEQKITCFILKNNHVLCGVASASLATFNNFLSTKIKMIWEDITKDYKNNA